MYGTDDLLDFEENERYELGKNNENSEFPRFNDGLLVRKGTELGRFNMGSTVVMLFEADEGFEFKVKEGDKVRYGDIVGVYNEKINNDKK